MLFRTSRRAAAALSLWGLRGALCLCGSAALLVASEMPALAQLQLGQIQGTVTNKDNGKPLNGVTIVVSGPALQGEQSEVTDSRGYYLITQLPPGDNYVIRFYFNDVVVEQQGIRISQNKTLTISPPIPTHKGKRDVLVFRERAPTVDTASANTGVEINQEILRNTAVRGRTYESAMSLAPGSSDVSSRNQTGGDVGVSFSGSTGNENALIIDGLNTTDLAYGLLSTQLNQYFIKEINVITGGYQAEYGRATGGVVSIVTNSGSNEFHGSVFGSWAPYMTTPQTVARLGEALAARSRQYQQYDFGFELGGPILKDRIWFYVGLAPTHTITRTERIVRTQSSSGMLSGSRILATRDPNYRPPGYLSSPDLYAGLDELALQTTEVGSRNVDEYQRIYNWIAKLQINLNADHNITLGYIGAPEFRNDYNSLRNDLAGQKIDRATQIHDVTAHYLGKVFDRKLQLDVIYGYHYQGLQELPYAPGSTQYQYRASAADPFSLSDFEDVSDCQRRDPQTITVNGMPKTVYFNPCPITAYNKNGYGQYKPQQILQRHAIQASGTLYLKALGTHAVKLGFDFEDNLSDNTRKYTGVDFDPSDPTGAYYNGRLVYQTDATGNQLRIYRGFGQREAENRFGDFGVPCGTFASRLASGTDVKSIPITERLYCHNYFRATTETRNYALYLRDSWNIAATGLVLNVGLRWEAQEIFGVDGSKQIALYDNIAPRIGAAWDPSRTGRAKIYANYGRFYQVVPMDINDRSFSGEGLLVGRSNYVGDCTRQKWTPFDNTKPVPVAVRSDGSPCSLGDPRLGGGGVFAPVAPGLKGQFIDEFVVGGQFDVGKFDIVVGAYYTYRNLGNIIEDLSVDGGNTYFIANPGAEPDPAVAKRLEEDAAAAQNRARLSPQDDQLQAEANAAQRRSDVYKAVAMFPKAKRIYHAGTLLVQKRLSNRFSILANYTYSRLIGNYPGPYNPYTNQLDPNISSQFDIIDLTVNRDGPLNNDRPHNIKATGFYVQPVLGGRGSVTASLTFTGISGRPIQTLGQHSAYGPRQTFILPSGTAGRTPFIWQIDAHIGYEHKLTDQVKLSIYGDVINLSNNREVTNVDDEYTFSIVDPIVHGQPQDLKRLRTNDGSQLVLNSNYGQPTAYQAPLFLRFGGRLSF
jgi:hypothetical protein